MPTPWSSKLIRLVYGNGPLLKTRSTAKQSNTAAQRILALAAAWIFLMAGISLVGPARESLSLDSSLINRVYVPYLISLSSITTVLASVCGKSKRTSLRNNSSNTSVTRVQRSNRSGKTKSKSNKRSTSTNRRTSNRSNSSSSSNSNSNSNSNSSNRTNRTTTPTTPIDSLMPHTLSLGIWMNLFFGIILLACQQSTPTLPYLPFFSNSRTVKSLSVGTFYVVTSAYAIFPVSVLWSELPETLLSIGDRVLFKHATLGRQAYTFFGLCLTIGSLFGSFFVQILASTLGTYSLIFASALSFQMALWSFNYASRSSRNDKKPTVTCPPPEKSPPPSSKSSLAPAVAVPSSSVFAVYRKSLLARGMLAYTAAYSVGVVVMYIERTHILKTLTTDERTGLLGLTGTISAVLTCTLQVLSLWKGFAASTSSGRHSDSNSSSSSGFSRSGGRNSVSTTTATLVTLASLPVTFALGVTALMFVPSTWSAVFSVVAVRVVSFVVVRPQREICWGAMSGSNRMKAKMLADSAGRKFGDLLVPVYAGVSGSIAGHLFLGTLVVGWLWVSRFTAKSFGDRMHRVA